MKKLNIHFASLIGIILSLALIAMSVYHYGFSYRDTDKLIMYSAIGVLILAVSYMWNFFNNKFGKWKDVINNRFVLAETDIANLKLYEVASGEKIQDLLEANKPKIKEDENVNKEAEVIK